MRRMKADQFTLGQLVRATGLARASLLHYESLGLLLPAQRSSAGYRLYGENELERLRTIRRFRDAGLSLGAIRELLAPLEASAGKEDGPAALLETRLLGLCQEVERLRGQQKLLARLLATPEFRAGQACGGKAGWMALLRRAGFDEQDMLQWHAGFEADSPTEHTAFLRSLGLPPAEVAAIRRAARAAGKAPNTHSRK
ncbi:MAG: MerR family transcriptional regulator [Zoogloea sp.]|nr:MerR family transcriptional regulator [Zoogloea sp.]